MNLFQNHRIKSKDYTITNLHNYRVITLLQTYTLHNHEIVDVESQNHRI